MKELKVYYAKLNNMGDLLSEYLVPEITGRKAVHCEQVDKFQVMGIGSCGGAVWSGKESGTKEFIKDKVKKSKCITKKDPCAIWGTGFLKNYYPRELQLIRQNVSFIAVRGALSKKIIENSLGYSINPVMCDGGILTAELLKKTPGKKYQVGLIPHYKELELLSVSGLENAFKEKYLKSIIIDLRKDPLEVIQQIAECEYIMSSSLHGCVVADSFGIPNLRIELSDIPGTGFKFDDYYSGYDLEVPAVVLNKNIEIPTVEQILDQYKLTPSMVLEKKNDMKECLNKFVSRLD